MYKEEFSRSEIMKEAGLSQGRLTHYINSGIITAPRGSGSGIHAKYSLLNLGEAIIAKALTDDYHFQLPQVRKYFL